MPPQLPPLMFYIRHGRTISNDFRPSRRTSATLPPSIELPLDRDAILSAEGREQALKLGDELAKVLIDSPYIIRAISSDLPRATETASLVLGVLKGKMCRDIPLLKDSRLREVGQGLVDPHIVVDHPELSTAFDDYWPKRLIDQHRILHRPIEGITERMVEIGNEYGITDIRELQGDSLKDVRERSADFLHDKVVNLEKPGQITLVFSHHQWISIASMPTIERPLEEVLTYVGESGKTPNCSITGYRYNDGQWELVGWGKTPQEISKIL